MAVLEVPPQNGTANVNQNFRDIDRRIMNSTPKKWATLPLAGEFFGQWGYDSDTGKWYIWNGITFDALT